MKKSRYVMMSILFGAASCGDSRQAGEFDPVTVAGDHHKVIIENDRVRVLDVVIPPGETTALHLHDLPSVFITLESASRHSKVESGLTVSTVERLDSDALPKTAWRNPGQFPVRVTNTDTVRFRAIRIEFIDE